MTSERTKNVKALLDKAAQSEKSEDAMRFSQAALNAANAIAQSFQVENAYPDKK